MKSLYDDADIVLNLIITGIPSIPKDIELFLEGVISFKPYYNWNTFNTEKMKENVKELEIKF